MLNTLHIQRGVTLIELMIGLVIVAILFTMGAPAFGEWIQNTRIRNSAESILNGLQLARAESVRRNALVRFQLMNSVDNSCAVSNTSSNWVVSLDDPTGHCADSPSDTAAPRIIQVRSAAEGSTTSIATSISETDAATGNAVGTAVFAGTLIFNGLGRVATSSLAAGNNATIDVNKLAADGSSDCIADSTPGEYRCMRIVVSPGGQIRMCNPALDLTVNPQGCKKLS